MALTAKCGAVHRQSRRSCASAPRPANGAARLTSINDGRLKFGTDLCDITYPEYLQSVPLYSVKAASSAIVRAQTWRVQLVTNCRLSRQNTPLRAGMRLSGISRLVSSRILALHGIECFRISLTQ